MSFSLVGHVLFSVVLENVIVVVATNIVGQPGLEPLDASVVVVTTSTKSFS